jgi:predicted GNAT family N-acyltransferase
MEKNGEVMKTQATTNIVMLTNQNCIDIEIKFQKLRTQVFRNDQNCSTKPIDPKNNLQPKNLFDMRDKINSYGYATLRRKISNPHKHLI